MAEKELPTPEEMQEMAEIDIRTVDTSSLVDIEQVQIQTGLQIILGRLKIRIAISPME